MSLAVSLLSFDMHTDTLILLTLTQSNFGARFFLLQMKTFFRKPTTLIIEICLCAPFSIASLERLFSQMNLIKTTLRNRLTEDSLNSILQTNISGGLSLQSFHDEHLENVLITGLMQKIVVYVNVNISCIKNAKVRRQNDLLLTFQTYHQNPRALPIYLHQKMKL